MLALILPFTLSFSIKELEILIKEGGAFAFDKISLLSSIDNGHTVSYWKLSVCLELWQLFLIIAFMKYSFQNDNAMVKEHPRYEITLSLACFMCFSGFSLMLALLSAIMSVTLLFTSNSIHKSMSYNFKDVGGNLDGEWQFGGQIEAFGKSLSVSSNGTRLAIGAPLHGKVNQRGCVKVFQLIDGVWFQLGKDLKGKVRKGGFGESVSISGDGTTVAVGAPLLDAGVTIFKLNISSANPAFEWSVLGDTLKATNGSETHFGSSVSLAADGMRLAVGVPKLHYTQLFIFNSGMWNPTDKIVSPIIERCPTSLGTAVSLNADGTKLAVLTPKGNECNYRVVQIYKIDLLGIYTQLGDDLDADQSAEIISLAPDGLRIAVAWGSSTVIVYALKSDKWIQLGTRIDTFAKLGNIISLSINIYKSRTYLVAVGFDNNVVRVYEYRSNGAWVQSAADLQGEYNSFGYAISLSEDGLAMAVGSPDKDLVQVFTLEENTDSSWW